MFLTAALVFTSGCGAGGSSAMPPAPNVPITPTGAGQPAANADSVFGLSTTQSATSSGPMHVKIFTFWNIGSIASSVPANWIAQWATFAEMDKASSATSFHAAGGKYAVAYTDPNYYYVASGYRAPGSFPSNAFGYGSNGVKSQRSQGAGTEYYLLPNSAGTVSGFKGVVDAIASGGGFNYVYADGVSDSLPISLYRISPTPIEISTTTQYVTGMKALMLLSPLPMIVNGYMNGNPITEEQTYLGTRNVAGMFGESCFTSYTTAAGDTPYQHPWSDMANALLATTARHYYAICGGRGTLADNRALRTYYLASWWLTFDPTYSVSLEIFSSPGNVYVFPEQAIVPTNADENPTTVSSLKWYTGTYVRRFDRCFYKGVSWGACAAVVNPSWAYSARIPRLPIAYHHSLSLDNYNLYSGGAAHLSTAVPTVLAPKSAAILFQ